MNRLSWSVGRWETQSSWEDWCLRVSSQRLAARPARQDSGVSFPSKSRNPSKPAVNEVPLLLNLRLPCRRSSWSQTNGKEDS
jgi:hypothetical protein